MSTITLHQIVRRLGSAVNDTQLRCLGIGHAVAALVLMTGLHLLSSQFLTSTSNIIWSHPFLHNHFRNHCYRNKYAAGDQ